MLNRRRVRLVGRAFPYRQPPADVVATSPWSYAIAGEVRELPPELTDWDYDSTVHLQRTLRVDGVRARTGCGLPMDSELNISVIWSATSSSMRGRVWQSSVQMRDKLELNIEFDLYGRDLGGRLDLDTVLTLASSGLESRTAAVPSRSGSVLWRETGSVLLQGNSVLFPISVVDFTRLPYPQDSAWHLELGYDLYSQALGSILLLVNKKNAVVSSALEDAASPSEADKRVLSVVRTEIIRSLVERALTDDDFDLDEEYPGGSIGSLLASVLRRHFPDRELIALRRERASEPMLFTTRLQSATKLLVTQ